MENIKWSLKESSDGVSAGQKEVLSARGESKLHHPLHDTGVKEPLR